MTEKKIYNPITKKYYKVSKTTSKNDKSEIKSLWELNHQEETCGCFTIEGCISYESYKKGQRDIIKKIENLFKENFKSSSFCSCYEGDLYERYNEAVKEFLEELSNN